MGGCTICHGEFLSLSCRSALFYRLERDSPPLSHEICGLDALGYTSGTGKERKPVALRKIKTIFAEPQAKIYLIMTLKNVQIY